MRVEHELRSGLVRGRILEQPDELLAQAYMAPSCKRRATVSANDTSRTEVGEISGVTPIDHPRVEQVEIVEVDVRRAARSCWGNEQGVDSAREFLALQWKQRGVRP